MSTSSTTTPLKTTLVSTAITPSPRENQLDPPFDDSATYDSSTNTLSVAVSIMIPTEISIEAVTLQQFYDSENTSELQFYFVYNVSGETSGRFQQYDCTFDAIPELPSGDPLNLTDIATLVMLMCDDDPKTSRGTVTPVSVS